MITLNIFLEELFIMTDKIFNANAELIAERNELIHKEGSR